MATERALALELSSWPEPAVDSRLKRLIDVAVAALLLVLLGPLFLVLAVLVRLTSRGPAFFAQDRIGFRCRRFRMYKFRSMRVGAERLEDELARSQPERTFLKIRNDPRVTRFGRWLRRSSLDELPQLWNVLTGEMSLVGPRPILPCDLGKFPGGADARRFAVRPGITGLWQVSGRSDRSDRERITLDLEYVERWSLGLDLAILARTIPAVLSGRGAS